MDCFKKHGFEKEGFEKEGFNQGFTLPFWVWPREKKLGSLEKW